MSRAIDDLVEHLLQHIALAGSLGVNPSEFERLVRDFYPQNTAVPPTSLFPLTDDDAASTSWIPLVDSFLLESVWTWLADRSEVLIGRNDEYSHLTLSEAKALHAQQGSNFSSAVEPTPTRPTKRTKRSKKSDDDKESSQASSDSSAGPVCLFTTEDRMWLAVCGHGVDHKRVPPLEFTLLSIIASHGSSGLAQTELTRLSGQDKRSLPKRTDNLNKKGYIIKKSIINRGTRTSLLILRRFADAGADQTGSSVADGSVGERLLSPDGQIHLDRVVDVIYDILKDAKTLPVETIKQRLGYNRLSWPKRFLLGALRKLAMIGLIVRIKVKVEYSSLGKSVLTKAIKLIRAPTDKDRALFLTIGEHEARVNDFQNSNSQNANAQSLRDDSSDDSDGEIDVLEAPSEGEVGQGKESDNTAITSISTNRPNSGSDLVHPVPQWDPDLPLTHMIFSAVHMAGQEGISSMDLRGLLFGTFWRRPFDTLMARLTDAWEKSQPPHLEHFVIIKDTAMTNKQVHFTYRTAASYSQLVASGQTVWEAVMSGTAQEAGPADQALSVYQHSWGAVDQWGLPLIKPEFLVNGNGFVSLSQLDAYARSRCHRPVREIREAPSSSFSTPIPRKRVRTGTLVAETPGTPFTPQTGASDLLHGSTGRVLSRRESEKRSKALAAKMAEYRKTLRPWAERIVTSVEPESLNASGDGPSSRPSSPQAGETRKKRKVGPGDVSGQGACPSSPRAPREQRIEAIMDELCEMKHPGVYIGPPSAMRVFTRGRPRSQLVVVIKSDKLQTARPKAVVEDQHSFILHTPTPAEKQTNDGHVQTAQMVASCPAVSSPTPLRRATERLVTTPHATIQTPEVVVKTEPAAASSFSSTSTDVLSLPPPPQTPNTPASLPGIPVPSSPAVRTPNSAVPVMTSSLLASLRSGKTPSPASPSLPPDTSPSTSSRPHKKNGGLFIGGGLMGFNRTKILLDLISKCGGVAPGGSELYQSFRDAWVAKYAGCQPDTKTMNRAILFASQSAQIIRIPFTFKDSNESEVTKYVIALPDMDRSNPLVSEMQEHIKHAYPEHYIPPQLDLGQRKKNIVFRDLYVLDSTTQLDPQTNVPLWVQRHMNNMQAIAERRRAKQIQQEEQKQARIIQMGSAKRRANAERRAWAPSTGSRPPDMMNLNSMSHQDINFSRSVPFKPTDSALMHIDPLLRDEGTEANTSSYSLSPSSRSSAPHGLAVGREQSLAEVAPEIERARSRLHFRKQIQTLFMPAQVFMPAMGVFGTFPLTDGRKVSGWSRAQNRPRFSRVSSYGEHGDGGRATARSRGVSLPYITCNPRQTKHAATGTFVDAIPMSTVTRRKQPVRFAPRVSKRVIPSSQSFPLGPEFQVQQSSGSKFSPSFTQAIASQPIVRKRRVRRTAPDALLAAVTGDHSVLSSSSPATAPSYKTKINQIAVPELNEKARLLLIIVTVVQILAGGISLTINWAIVQKVCDFFPRLAFPKELPRLAYRWRCISKSHEGIVDEFTDQFRTAFLKAYAAGEIDKIDYNALGSYNWIKLIAWANDAIDLNKIIADYKAASAAEADAPLLPNSAAELQEMYDIQVVGSAGLSCLPETFYNIKSLHTLRNIRMHETRFADLWTTSPSIRYLPPSVFLADDARRIVYSIIRASVATPEEAFSASDASRRVSALPVNLIELALRDLMRRGLITKTHSGGAIAPGRNWRLSDVFWSIFDRTVTREMFIEAARFKKGLDRLFMMGERPVLQIGTNVPDGQVLALVNLVEQGQCVIEPMIPENKGVERPPELEPDYQQFRASFISRWGWLGERYQTRRMDRSLMYLPIQIIPTDRYVYSREGKGGVAPEMGAFELCPPDLADVYTCPVPSPEGDLLASQRSERKLLAPASTPVTSSSPPAATPSSPVPIPIWRDIHGALNRPLWFRLVSALVQIISMRPGIGLHGILIAFKDMLEDWELKACVDWMVKAGIVVWESNPMWSETAGTRTDSSEGNQGNITGIVAGNCAEDAGAGGVPDEEDTEPPRSRWEGLKVREWWWLAPAVWADVDVDGDGDGDGDEDGDGEAEGGANANSGKDADLAVNVENGATLRGSRIENAKINGLN